MNRTLKYLGIGSYCYPFLIGAMPKGGCVGKEDIFRLIDKAVLKNVGVVQIGDNVLLEKMSMDDRTEIGKYAKNSKICLELGLRGIEEENLNNYIFYARQMNVELIRAVCDKENFCPTIDELVSILRKVSCVLEKNNLILGVETHDRFTAEELRNIMEEVDSPHVGVVLDVTNSLVNEERPLDTAKILAPFTVNLHIKDYAICRRKKSMGLVIKGTPAGYGRLNIPELVKIVRKNSPYLFNTILEFWMEAEDTLEASVRKEEDWVSQSIEYLSPFFLTGE